MRLRSRFLDRHWLGAFFLRFVILYAVLTYASLQFPIFEVLESASVALVDVGYSISISGEAQRSVELVELDGVPTYRLGISRPSGRTELHYPYHPHGYIAMLYVAVVLATPAVDRRRRLLWLVGGTFGVLLLATGLLVSDLALWLADAELAPGPPSWSPIGLLGGLHRTSGAVLLPVLLWMIVVSEVAGPKRRVAA